MLRILFIKPRSIRIKKVAVPPMGIMYLSAYLKDYFKKDVEIKIIDNRLYEYNERQLYDRIKEFDPAIVGISSLTVEAQDMHTIARAAKGFNKNIFVLAGGPHPSQYYDEVVRDPNINVVIKGEGEVVLLELIRRYLAVNPYNDLKGIVFLKNGQIVSTPNKEFITNIDTIPFPAWDLIDIDAYARINSMATIGTRRYMTLYTSRGCPYGCTYCHGLAGRIFRARSIENVCNEIDLLVRRCGIYDFEIIDDIFNLDYKRAEGILDYIISRSYKIRISFPNGLRSDLLDYNMLNKMKKAGVIFISFAIETASERMQRVVNKMVNLKKAKEAISISSSELAILSNGFFMLGFPGETKEEMLQTVDFAVRSKLDTAYFFIVTPFKRTPIFEKNKERIAGRFSDISYSAYTYFRGFFNLSDIPDKELVKIQQMAYVRFYFSPKRIARIISRYLHLQNGIYAILSNFLMVSLLIVLRKLDRAKTAA